VVVTLGLVRRVVVVVVVVVRWRRRIVVGQFMSSSRSSGSRGPLRLVVRQGRLVTAGRQAVVSMMSWRLLMNVVVVVLIGRVMVVLVLVWADAFGERVPPAVSLLLGELVLEDVPLLLEHVQLALEGQHALVGARRRRGPLVLLGLVVVVVRLKVVHDGQARVVDGGRGLVVLTVVGGCGGGGGGGGGVVVVVEGGHGGRPLLPLHHRVVDVPQQLPDRRQSFTTI